MTRATYADNAPQGYMGDWRRGAPMGRSSRTGEPVGRVSLRRIRLDSGGYDECGAYWGHGDPLYWAGSDCGALDMTFRVGRSDVSAAFAARGGVRIGEPGYEAFRTAWPRWSEVGTREAAKDAVRAVAPDARFYR